MYQKQTAMVGDLASITAECRKHLELALESEDPSEKDFHIRQALQLVSEESVAPSK